VSPQSQTCKDSRRLDKRESDAYSLIVAAKVDPFRQRWRRERILKWLAGRETTVGNCRKRGLSRGKTRSFNLNFILVNSLQLSRQELVSLWAIVVPHGTIYRQPGWIPRKVTRSQAALDQNGETGTTGSPHRCLESRQLPTASSMNTPYI
jgi:hypothetical protein